MKGCTIKIKELELDGETAIKVFECLKKNEPEIWSVLKVELKKAIKEEKTFCFHACSPSDWKKGGKCDKNGCYTN